MRFPEWSLEPSNPTEGVNCWWIMNGAMVIGHVDGPQSDERQLMRGRLIAAAPDLYKALAAIVDGGPVDEYAKAALAKARGERT